MLLPIRKAVSQSAAILFILLTSWPAIAGPRKSLVIAVDGLRTDGLLSTPTPNIDRLLDGSFGGGGYHGAFAPDAQTIQDGPTSSAYNHCSIMTGVTGAKHGVDANTAAALAAVDYGAYPHYLATLEQADPGLNTAYFVTWTPDLSIVSGADYIKDADDESNTDRVAAIFEETFEDPLGDDGTAWSLGTDPDAIFIFLDDTDGTGHGWGFGPWIPEYLAQVEVVDDQVGRMLAAIEARPSFATESWQVILVSDHGGIGTGHGGLTPNEETIPFIVTSQDVTPGFLSGVPMNMDAASTAIAHVLGAAAVPPHHDGMALGDDVLPDAPADLARDLVLHLAFDGDFLDSSGRSNHAALGAGIAADPTLRATGGACGGYLEIADPGPGAVSYLTLGTPADLELGTDVDFTLSVWLRAAALQSGDSVIFGNKDWVDGFNSGALLLANEGDGDDFGFNLADGTLRNDVEPIDFELDEWWLLAVSVDRDRTAMVFVGSPDGRQFLIADEVWDLGDVSSPLPWNIGQDGTGFYPTNLAADLDDLRAWRRALRLDELQRLHAAGLGTCSRRLLLNALLTQLSPPAPFLADVLPLDPVADFYRSVLPFESRVPVEPGPLVFFALEGPGVIRAEKIADRELRISF